MNDVEQRLFDLVSEIHDEMAAERYSCRWLVSQSSNGGWDVWEVYANPYRELFITTEYEARWITDSLNDGHITLNDDDTINHHGERFQVHKFGFHTFIVHDMKAGRDVARTVKRVDAWFIADILNRQISE